MRTYMTTQGQTWDMIAYEVYGDELKADILMAANPKHIEIFVFPAGIELNIPKIDESETLELPPWRDDT